MPFKRFRFFLVTVKGNSSVFSSSNSAFQCWFFACHTSSLLIPGSGNVTVIFQPSGPTGFDGVILKVPQNCLAHSCLFSHSASPSDLRPATSNKATNINKTVPILDTENNNKKKKTEEERILNVSKLLVYIIQLVDNEKRLSIVLIQHKISTDSTEFPENMIHNLNLDLIYQYITPSIRHMIGMEVVINPRQTLCQS